MALSIGTVSAKVDNSDALTRARLRAGLVPDLLVEAQRIAANVVSGWHGRRRRGSGDTFWQFRPYDTGESLTRIDWRRSARDDSITIRDKELEAAHTVWVWADNSPSMLYQSSLSEVSKQSRAMVLALALCEVLARSGERVGWPGLTRAISSRSAAERVAGELMGSAGEDTGSFPPLRGMVRRHSLVVISDFLEPISDVLARVDAAAQMGVEGILIQISDPAEETFPYSGRTEFRDPETGRKFTAGRAETLHKDYERLFNARREVLAEHCKRLGWHHITHRTDQLASSALVAAHMRLSGQVGGAR
ncbi:DUF58 domain-containing protein [Pseudahrensia aquimaris]|uniref:DUF58 domain-containing protein n=1 Tax=Pseudahrensia aquimaris TaxID=744461 RepID=A0ABW3FHC0_9HYPH